VGEPRGGGRGAALFGWRTARAPHPFVPPALLANRPCRTAVLVAALTMAVNLGALVLVPLLVVDVGGLAPGAGALVVIPAGIAVAAPSPAIGRMSDAVGTRPLVPAGLAAVAGALNPLHRRSGCRVLRRLPGHGGARGRHAAVASRLRPVRSSAR